MGDKKENSDTEEKKPVIIRNSTDLQRLKLEKLMSNPDKPVIIPEKPKERGVPTVPDFVRNVMGSSAGAGSGEFHVYRHLRRKEYARQKFMKERAEKDRLEDEYHQRLEENKKIAEERTAKKRQKRLKKKQKFKKCKPYKKVTSGNKNEEIPSEKESSTDCSDESDDDTRTDDTNTSTTESVKSDIKADNIIVENENLKEIVNQ